MLARLTMLEQRKTFGRKNFWIILASAVLLVGGLLVLIQIGLSRGMAAEAENALDLTWPAGLVFMFEQMLTPSTFAALLVVVLACGAMSQEYSWRTLHQWVSRGVSRTNFVLAKFAVLALAMVPLMVFPVLVGALVTGAFSYAAQGILPLDQADLAQLTLSPLRLAYGLLPLAALTLWFGVVTRSTVGALGGGLIYALLGEGLIAGFLQIVTGLPVGVFMPGGLVAALAAQNLRVDPAAVLPPLPLSTPVVLAGIAVWTALFLVLTAWTLHRQDLSG